MFTKRCIISGQRIVYSIAEETVWPYFFQSQDCVMSTLVWQKFQFTMNQRFEFIVHRIHLIYMKLCSVWNSNTLTRTILFMQHCSSWRRRMLAFPLVFQRYFLRFSLLMNYLCGAFIFGGTITFQESNDENETTSSIVVFNSE